MNYNYSLGMKYYNGKDGYQEDVEKAIIYFELALDEGCYEAAYQLGLCYYEGIENAQIDRAIHYMEIADQKYVDDATEWLADYYLKKDVIKSLDYALDVPSFLNNYSSAYIKHINQYLNSIPLDDSSEIIDAIDLFERFWKRTKNKNSDFCKCLSSTRNNLLRHLCALLEQYSLNEEISAEIIEFLQPYKSDLKLSFISQSLDKSFYQLTRYLIVNANNKEEIDSLRYRLNNAPSALKENLLSICDYKNACFILSQDDYADEDLDSIGAFIIKHRQNAFLLESIKNEIRVSIERKICESKYNIAKKLCLAIPYRGSFKDGLLISIELAKQREKENVKVESPSERFARFKESYLSSFSQLDFNQLFDLGWSLSKYDELCDLMLVAKKHNTSFDYIQNKYRDDFLKRIISNLKQEFFAEDIDRIKREISRRDIRALVHFTPIENKQSILENGLLSRIRIEQKHLKATYTDSNKFDGFFNHISLSITRENTKMLWYKIFQDVMKKGIEIFLINPAILYEHPESAIYCNCNASSKNAASHRDYGYRGLMSMFESDTLYPNDTNMPTNVQAEVLFKGEIDKNYILSHYQMKI